MNLRLKKRFFWIVGIFIILSVILFSVNYSVKTKLVDRLDNFSETVKIDYQDISLNAVSGRVTLTEPTFLLYGKTTDSVNLKVSLKELNIEGFSHWSYFMNQTISVDHVFFDKPNITYYHNDLIKNDSYNKSFSENLKYDVEIGLIEFIDGHFEVYKTSNDSLSLKIDAVNLNIEDFLMGKDSNAPKLEYENFNAKTEHLFFEVSDFEHLILKEVDFNSELAKFKGITINTKYSKEALSKQIKTERDHYVLNIDSIEIKEPKIGLENDTLGYFKSPVVTIYHADFNVFRDKLLPDNLLYRPLYSKLLRDLNFKLGLDELIIKKTSINYIEKVKINSKGGALVFSNLNANIKNVGNIYNHKTFVALDAIFMDNTPLNVQWGFDVQNLDDAFVFKSEIGHFQADALNQFMTPNLNVKLDGEVEKLFFTISGNDRVSNIDAKLKYDNFDVIILKENGKEKNKLLSAILNVFISKDSRDDAEKFSHGSKEVVERDRTKSVFSFVWLNLRDALLNAIVGNGEKSE